jgi:RNA polymerase sigma factor (sigma-70 family)
MSVIGTLRFSGTPSRDPHVSPIGVAIERIASASDAAFEAIYRDHYRDVYRYVLVLTRHAEDADDITAETFERAFRAWRRSDGPKGEPLPWLFLVARRIATDRWRRARRVLRQRLNGTVERLPDAQADPETWLWLDAFARVLPERQREVILLRYHRDLSDADIGALMRLSPSGVRSLVARAIATLRSHPEVWR